MGHDFGMKSRAHSKYKTKYRVSNRAEYDGAKTAQSPIDEVEAGLDRWCPREAWPFDTVNPNLLLDVTEP